MQNSVFKHTASYTGVGRASQPLSVSTFAVILIPWVNTVLDAIADQGVVDAHVTVTEESVSFTWS